MKLLVSLEKSEEMKGRVVLRKKGAGLEHVRTTRFRGLPINIEIDRGMIAEGKDPDGKPWRVKYTHPYGEIDRTEGRDEDPVDIYLGDHKDAEKVYVVHQLTRDGKYDEDKVMLGFETSRAAKKCYLDHHSGATWAFGSMETLTFEEFKHGYLAATRDNGLKKSMGVVPIGGFSVSYGNVGRSYDYPEKGFIKKNRIFLKGEDLPFRLYVSLEKEKKSEMDRTYARRDG